MMHIMKGGVMAERVEAFVVEQGKLIRQACVLVKPHNQVLVVAGVRPSVRGGGQREIKTKIEGERGVAMEEERGVAREGERGVAMRMSLARLLFDTHTHVRAML